MKVLVLVPDLRRPGGVANYYRCLELDKEPDIEYMSINSISTEPKKNQSYSHVRILLTKVLNLPKVYFNFIRLLPNYQTVHLNPSLDFKSYFRDIIFILIARLYRKRLIIFFRGWDDKYEARIRHSRFLSFLFRHSFAKSNEYIVLGEIFKNKLLALGASSKSLFYMESTIADSRFLQYFDLDKKISEYNVRINFLFISRILKEKGIYIAIDSFAKCQQQTDRPLQLTVAGDGSELENAKTYVEKKKIKNIQFIGYVKDDLKKNVLLQSHIILFPTMYGEGLPNSILEGMLYGMPVVSSTVGGIPDVVKSDINGYLVNTDNSDDYASVLLGLINDKLRYEKMAKLNHEKAKALFTTEAVKNRLVSIYTGTGNDTVTNSV